MPTTAEVEAKAVIRRYGVMSRDALALMGEITYRAVLSELPWYNVQMDRLHKLTILADAVKYDSSCASSGARRASEAPTMESS